MFNGYTADILVDAVARIATALEKLVELKQEEQKTPERKKLEKLMKDRLNVMHGMLYPYSGTDSMK